MAIRPVLDFLNTVDLRTYGDSRALLDRDQLADPVRTVRWLREQRIPAPTGGVSNDARALQEIREQLRAALVGEGSLRLDGSVVVTIEPGAPATVEPGQQSALAEAIVALVIRAAVSPEWRRLRICDAQDCRRAFYDLSRNGRSRWCSMRTCGNRMKTRSYRQRSRDRAAPAASSVPRSPSTRRQRTNTFRREGEYWTISSAGRRFRLRDSKGLRYLARLLAEPHREFHVMDLVGGRPAGGGAHKVRPPYALLDDHARRSYRARLATLRGEIEEAESWADAGRLSRARDEMQFISEELERSTGIAGRDRWFSTDSERARVSVTRVIKAALTRIAEESPELKHHFASTVRTGTYCSYKPDPRLPVRWEL